MTESQQSGAAEQIGDLIFAPNPDYPYPFPVERPPHFWMTEQTGRLAEAVEAYMNGERLEPAQIGLIKIYLRQYIERALLTGEANRKKLVDEIGRLKTAREIERFADEIAGYGVEAF